MSSTSETSASIHALTKCRKWVSAGTVGRTGSCVEKGNRWAKHPPSWFLAGDRCQAVVCREVGAYVENGWVEPNRCATESSQGAGTHSVILYICNLCITGERLSPNDSIGLTIKWLWWLLLAVPVFLRLRQSMVSRAILSYRVSSRAAWLHRPHLKQTNQKDKAKEKCWGLCACWQVCGCTVLGRREEWWRQSAHQFLQNMQKVLAMALLFLGTVWWERACPTCVRSQL